MGFLKNLFKRGEDPLPVFSDEMLGPLNWDQNTESWQAVRNGVTFGLSYDYEKAPKEEVIRYARRIVLDDGWYDKALNRAKEIAINEYPESYRKEIESLTIKTLCFFDGTRLHIQFFENDDEPWWFAEATNGEVEYVGFDT